MIEPSTPSPSPSPRPQGKRGRSSGPQAFDEPLGGTTQWPPPGMSPGQNRPPLAAKRRRTRSIIIAVVGVALLGLLVHQLVWGGSVTTKIGETYTPTDGAALNVGTPQKYAPAGVPPAPAGEQIYQVIVTVNNPTDEKISTSDVVITATVDGTEAPAVYPDGPITQDIEPGVQLNVPFRFTVKDGVSGPLQVTVNEPGGKVVYFNGTI